VDALLIFDMLSMAKHFIQLISLNLRRNKMKKYMSLFLTTVVFLTSIFAEPASAHAATLNGSYILSANGAPTVAISGKVYAALLPDPPAENWVITPVSASGEDVVMIQTGDLSKAWTVPSNDDSTQITVEPLISGAPAPNQLFRIVLPEPDLQNRIQILTKISDQGIGRSRVEDFSLLPKRVVVLPQGSDIPYWLVARTK